jgi:probable phosphoglycerate mutase
MIYLIRHGQTALNAARVVQHPDTTLDAIGVQQAERLGARMAEVGLTRILSSDYPRARRTAAALDATGTIPTELTPLLRERDLGALDGHPYAGVEHQFFGPDHDPPGGEAWPAFLARVARAWAHVGSVARGGTERVAVVTHGLVIRALTELHLTYGDDATQPVRFRNTSVTIIDPTPPWTVRLSACARHLEQGPATKQQRHSGRRHRTPGSRSALYLARPPRATRFSGGTMTTTRRLATGLVALGWIPTLAFIGAHWVGDTHAAAQARTPIKVTRMFTGPDNQTHAEEYDVRLGELRGATELSETVDVTSLQFRRTSLDYDLPFHTAPRRQYVITLSGESEVEFGDGTKVRLYPGHILLAEDTTGQGHISRAIGTEDRISLFIPLADE